MEKIKIKIKKQLQNFIVLKPFRTIKEYDVDEILLHFFGVKLKKTQSATIGYSYWSGANFYECKKGDLLFCKEETVGPASSVKFFVVKNKEEIVLFEQKYGHNITNITDEQLDNFIKIIKIYNENE